MLNELFDVGVINSLIHFPHLPKWEDVYYGSKPQGVVVVTFSSWHNGRPRRWAGSLQRPRYEGGREAD